MVRAGLLLVTTMLPLLLAAALAPGPRPGAQLAPKVVYAVFEGSRLNVYAQQLVGGRSLTPPKLLFFEEAPPGNVRPLMVMIPRISPRGTHIAYRLEYVPGQPSPWGYGPLFLVDPHGKHKRKLAERVLDFLWSPEGDRVLYALPPTPLPPYAGMPVEAPGSEWRLLDVATGQEEVVAREGDSFVGVAAWVGRKVVFNKGYLRQFAVFDLKTHREIGGQGGLSMKTGQLNPNPSGTRALLIGQDHPADSQRCAIYEVTPDWRLGRKLVFHPDSTCDAVGWNSDAEVFYRKSPPLSVCRHDFATRTEHTVLEGNGNEGLVFLGLIPGKAMIVSRHRHGRAPWYVLETRGLDGSNPVVIRTGAREIMFVGWLP
jgi:hypothetical protein